MEKFFSVFGKIVLVVLVVGGAAGAAFYYGRQTAPAPEANSIEAPIVTLTPSPTPDASQSATVTAGVGEETPLSFVGTYAVDLAAGWTHTREHDAMVPTDTLTLNKSGHTIKIYQAATGGAMCLYPGDAPLEGPAMNYNTFSPIVTADGTQLRRSGTQATPTSFSVCQRSQDGSYQQPTRFGHIQYAVPNAVDAKILTEMDTMLTTLRAQ